MSFRINGGATVTSAPAQYGNLAPLHFYAVAVGGSRSNVTFQCKYPPGILKNNIYTAPARVFSTQGLVEALCAIKLPDSTCTSISAPTGGTGPTSRTLTVGPSDSRTAPIARVISGSSPKESASPRRIERSSRPVPAERRHVCPLAPHSGQHSAGGARCTPQIEQLWTIRCPSDRASRKTRSGSGRPSKLIVFPVRSYRTGLSLTSRKWPQQRHHHHVECLAHQQCSPKVHESRALDALRAFHS